MPSNNPKHARKKVVYTRKKTLKQSGIPIRYWIMGGIGVVLITAVILVAVNIDDLTDSDNGTDDPTLLNTIVDGCYITLDYKIYSDLNDDGVIVYLGDNPEIHAFIDLHTTQVTRENLITGWYEGMIGMNKEDSKIIDIEEFVDDDGDGRHDTTGNLPMGYTSGVIAYKELKIWVKIIEIYAEDTFDSSTVTYTNPSDPILPKIASLSIFHTQITSAPAYGKLFF
ncbi:MAG: hypothetical protein ACTSRK_03695 [Promethearchaeota archaeon]